MLGYKLIKFYRQFRKKYYFFLNVASVNRKWTCDGEEEEAACYFGIFWGALRGRWWGLFWAIILILLCLGSLLDITEDKWWFYIANWREKWKKLVEIGG